MLTSFWISVDVGVVRDRAHQEDPRDDADADRDDQRVDEAFPVAARAAPADEQQDAGDQAGIDRQVRDVADRGERQLAAEELVVVVGDDVAGDEERLTEREQVPRRLAPPASTSGPRTRSRSARTTAIRLKNQPCRQPGTNRYAEQRRLRSHR